ncbi:MAG: BolA/IbaG family iron-sulfur metabolism protein [Candidatus Dadabacteria bacterium]|jgi:acid stress-induced BolA-like protein IbaG/YrbA|nr:BolA/IbaG family iron-sulfur metabolism protein [Candidatus Dadabacteria bacterium]MXZ48367.1 BolA/IbaG family iron-sulfur metabolism protein [Candidatus Dadabacteria bacterium]MYB27004.1 BolA/IbaG family iron-sulfur metabolism protein [Candidatus Dadabacteria bacterium]MYI73381.1 BolA/IbaG family iron-sulfur metabolism protein [Candidatus Dadabacteria bacterium]
METQRIREMIEQGISTSFVEVEGDGTHFQAVVVSEQFRGKPPIERHKLVYAALGDAMESEIHAISIKTYTDDQWEKLKK